LSKKKTDEAILLMDNLGVTNDMLKEHLLDLCMNENIKQMFDRLSTA
jgi:putative aminopeptidase FrvX